MRHFDNGAIRAFVSELQETLPQVAAALDDAAQRHDRAPLAEAHRLLHCLKGAAGMVGLPALAYLINLGEDVVERGLAPDADPASERIQTTRACLPRFEEYLTAAAAGGTISDLAWFASILVDELHPGADDIDNGTLEKLLDIDRRELAAGAPPTAPSSPDTLTNALLDEAFDTAAAGAMFDQALDDTLGALPAFDGELALPDDALDSLLTSLSPVVDDVRQ